MNDTQWVESKRQNELNLNFLEAAINGDIEKVMRYEELGADIHANKNYAFIASAGEGHIDVVKYFIEKNTSPNAVADYSRSTPLKLSASNGHFEVVKFLVENGATIFN